MVKDRKSKPEKQTYQNLFGKPTLKLVKEEIPADARLEDLPKYFPDAFPEAYFDDTQSEFLVYTSTYEECMQGFRRMLDEGEMSPTQLEATIDAGKSILYFWRASHADH